jgi:hypothetical protein
MKRFADERLLAVCVVRDVTADDDLISVDSINSMRPREGARDYQCMMVMCSNYVVVAEFVTKIVTVRAAAHSPPSLCVSGKDELLVRRGKIMN